MTSLSCTTPSVRFFKSLGFTLAETLVALLILSIISVYSIPKVLRVTNNNAYDAAYKEFFSSIASAHNLHKARGLLNTNTLGTDLTQYINYVSVDTLSTTLIDQSYGTAGTTNCAPTPGVMCLKLHSGAILRFSHHAFCGTGNQAVRMHFDPDGKVTTVTAGATDAGKAMNVFLYYNGRITTFDSINPSTETWNSVCGVVTVVNPTVGTTPEWFTGW